MCEACQFRYVLHTVARSGTRTKTRGTDIDRIGAVLYRFNPALPVTRRSKQFYPFLTAVSHFYYQILALFSGSR